MSQIPHNPHRPQPPSAAPAPASSPGQATNSRPAPPLRPLTPQPADTSAGAHRGELGDAGSALAGMQFVEEDDRVAMPALAPEQFASNARYGPPETQWRTRSLFLRRTFIPILITCGVLLPALAVLWFLTDADSVIRTTGLWLPVTFLVLGAVFLLLAVINMAQVRYTMSQS